MLAWLCLAHQYVLTWTQSSAVDSLFPIPWVLAFLWTSCPTITILLPGGESALLLERLSLFSLAAGCLPTITAPAACSAAARRPVRPGRVARCCSNVNPPAARWPWQRSTRPGTARRPRSTHGRAGAANSPPSSRRRAGPSRRQSYYSRHGIPSPAHKRSHQSPYYHELLVEPGRKTIRSQPSFRARLFHSACRLESEELAHTGDKALLPFSQRDLRANLPHFLTPVGYRDKVLQKTLGWSCGRTGSSKGNWSSSSMHFFPGWGNQSEGHRSRGLRLWIRPQRNATGPSQCLWTPYDQGSPDLVHEPREAATEVLRRFSCISASIHNSSALGKALLCSREVGHPFHGRQNRRERWWAGWRPGREGICSSQSCQWETWPCLSLPLQRTSQYKRPHLRKWSRRFGRGYHSFVVALGHFCSWTETCSAKNEAAFSGHRDQKLVSVRRAHQARQAFHMGRSSWTQTRLFLALLARRMAGVDLRWTLSTPWHLVHRKLAGYRDIWDSGQSWSLRKTRPSFLSTSRLPTSDKTPFCRCRVLPRPGRTLGFYNVCSVQICRTCHALLCSVLRIAGCLFQPFALWWRFHPMPTARGDPATGRESRKYVLVTGTRPSVLLQIESTKWFLIRIAWRTAPPYPLSRTN